MKISMLLLAGSLAANVALVAILVAGATEKPNPKSRSRADPPAANIHRIDVTSTVSESGAWGILRSDDLIAERERLRSEGFSPQMIRAILTAQVRESFSARRKALDAAQAEMPFWKNAVPDPKTQAEMRALSKEEAKVLKDLLGPDPENSTATYLRRQIPGVSEDKIEQIAQIRDRYDEQRNDLYAAQRGFFPLADQTEKMNALDRAMRMEFAAVLSPDEFADYEMRTSRTASQLRYDLAAFDATEAEYRALYKLRNSFDEQYGQNRGGMSEAEMRVRSDAQKQLNDQIAATLGPERYADYQRATNYDYRQLSQLVARLELPPDAAKQIYAVQQDVQRRAGTIRETAPSPEERTTQLTALAAEAQTKITATLGANGFEAYKQYGGSWLQRLVPRPASPPKL